MFCWHCGTENPDSSQFCPKCGTTLAKQPLVQNAGAALASAGAEQTSGKAIASLVCGILFFIFPSALAAVVLGHLSLTEIRKSAGRLAGQGLATAGLVLGYIGLAGVPFILIIAAIAIPNLLRARMAANEAGAVSSLRTIFAANISYASEYRNGYATELGELDGGEGGSANCNHAQLLRKSLASAPRYGYRLTYAPKQITEGEAAIAPEAAARGCTVPGATGYGVTADPVNRGSTGQRSFFVDETGVIRVEASGTATADSPPLQ